MKRLKRYNEDFEQDIEITPEATQPECDSEIESCILSLKEKLEGCLEGTTEDSKVDIYNKLIGLADDMCDVLGCTEQVGDEDDITNEFEPGVDSEEIIVDEMEPTGVGEGKKFWMKDATKNKGALRSKLGKKEGEKISKSEINSKISTLKKKEDKTAAEKKELKELYLARTLGKSRKKAA